MPSFDRVDADQLLSALINEATKARVRNRALVDTLVDNGIISMADYIRHYQEAEERDFKSFADLLLLPKGEFENKHADWIATNKKRYGFHRRIKQGVSLIEEPEDHDATTALKSLPSPRKRKKSIV